MVVYTKPELRGKAIQLRRKGLSYSEILKEVPVAKSTLSLWLRSVGLSKQQKQRLTEKKLAAALRGSASRKRQRILITQEIYRKAIKEVGAISNRELWLMGAMLYWAEGAKEKEWNVGQRVAFSNSDAEMIKLFLKWLRLCGISRNEIFLEIYIHENSKNDLSRVVNYWSSITGFPRKHFSRIYFKKNKIGTKRRNIDESYYGLLRVGVGRSSNFNRQIAGWVKGVIESLG